VTAFHLFPTTTTIVMSERDEYNTPRVNAARVPQYVGKTVRLVCKVDRFSGNTARVLASDGGELNIVITNQSIASTFVEVVGTVQDSSTIKALMCQSLGDDLDLKLVNDVTELSHDKRFAGCFST
jgi:replication factor A3